mmetsp:Transcript_9183/g.22719  ORF Transcript_9183/g.22719 Transcript_9183/m.22719 type:complete len:270 (+) Transcript_9183:779-1588(+)
MSSWTSLRVLSSRASSLGRPNERPRTIEASVHSSTRRLYFPSPPTAFKLWTMVLAITKVPPMGSGTEKALTGLKSISLAKPRSPMIEMAWSMPPDIVPTYFSHSRANSAISSLVKLIPLACITARLTAQTSALEDERPDPCGTRPSTTMLMPFWLGHSTSSGVQATFNTGSSQFSFGATSSSLSPFAGAAAGETAGAAAPPSTSMLALGAGSPAPGLALGSVAAAAAAGALASSSALAFFAGGSSPAPAPAACSFSCCFSCLCFCCLRQ